MQRDPHYDDVVGEVKAFLEQRLNAARRRRHRRRANRRRSGLRLRQDGAHNLELLRLKHCASCRTRRCSSACRGSRRWANHRPGRRRAPRRQPRDGFARAAGWRGDTARTRREGNEGRDRGLAGVPEGRVRPSRLLALRARDNTQTETFRTDGVRGTIGQSPMTPDFVLRLGYAAGKVLSGKQGGQPSGADRQGHAHLGLHGRVGARGRAFRPPASTCTCAARCRRRRSRT